MFDFSSNSQRACSARAFLFLRESAVPDRRWVRRVRPLMANRELSRQGSQHSPYVLAKNSTKDLSPSLSLSLSFCVRVCVERDLLSTIVIRSSLDKASRWNLERVRVRKDLFVLALFEFFSRFFEPGETLCLAFRFEPSRAPSVGKEIPSRFFRK